MTGDKVPPRFVGLENDFVGVFLVLSFARERKLVLRLAVGDLVDAKPLVRGTNQARKMALNVFNICPNAMTLAAQR